MEEYQWKEMGIVTTTNNNKPTITLPGEEGEWESVGYSFQGEPNSGGTITFHDWPGNENLRVLVRKKEPKRPEVQLYDAVNVVGVDNQGVTLRCHGATVINIEDYRWVTIVTNIGEQHVMPLDSIQAIYRNGRKVYPSTP